MTVRDWSDYHAWHVSTATMGAALLALPDAAYVALFESASIDGAGYVVPREAIEAAALAMPEDKAAEFLAAIYNLHRATAAQLLLVIQQVRALPTHHTQEH